MANKVTDGLNRGVPFFISEYGYVDISAADFDPLTTLTDWDGAFPEGVDDTRYGTYLKNGFLARPNADGNFYAISWTQLERAMGRARGRTRAAVLATLVPQLYNGMENQWVECLLVKVFASDDQSYATVATSINVGLIL